MFLLVILQLIAAGLTFGAVIWHPEWFRPILATFALGLVLLFGFNSQIFHFEGGLKRLDEVIERVAKPDATAVEECDRMLVFVDQLNLIGSIESGEMPVRTDLWDRLPANVQLAVEKCASIKYNAGRSLEIVKQ